MTPSVVLQAEDVAKKFCRRLTRAMWYGAHDVVCDTFGVSTRPDQLRTEEFWAVDGVNFDLHAGECLGIVGHNGAGKSTLLKMLNGIIAPDRGRIARRGTLGALIEVGAGFHPQLTGRENIFVNGSILGMTRREILDKFDSIVEFSNIGDFLDTPVKFYSSGMYVRLGMAVALHTVPQILLVDEVFAVGDMKFQAKCFNRIGEMRRQGVSFVLVSHNIHQISSYADRVLVLDHGKQLQLGDPEPAIAQYLELMGQKETSEAEAPACGSGRVRFGQIEVRDSQGQPANQLAATSAAAIEIEYEADIDCENVELELILTNGANQAFLHTTNRLTEQRLRVQRGTGTFHVTLPALMANSDALKILVSLWSPRREELFDWRRETVIQVAGHPQSTGQVWTDATFDVEFKRAPAAQPAADPQRVEN